MKRVTLWEIAERNKRLESIRRRRTARLRLFDCFAVCFILSVAILVTWGCEARGAEPPHTAHRMELPVPVRQWFRNPDGSCVQCSNGMVGAQINQDKLTTLLFESEYGPAVRGGSSPSRVENYCNQRGIRIFNVTGKGTWDWMRWAAKNGRFAAIGAGRMHFQTLYGWDPNTNLWYVCNNNSPNKVDTYTWEQFQQLHLASGQWVVVPDYPPMPAAPVYVEWWR